MAMVGRTTLMARALKRLLTQVLRHHHERYEALPEDLRARYEKKGGSSCFGWQPKESSAEQRRQARQQVAEDMYFVLAFYDGEAAITNKDTYKQLQMGSQGGPRPGGLGYARTSRFGWGGRSEASWHEVLGSWDGADRGV